MQPLYPPGPENGSFAPSPSISNALVLLRNARKAAIDLELDPSEFAVGLPMLVAAGLSVAEVRQILDEGLVKCGQETMPADADRRSLDAAADPSLTGRSCLFLTPAGERWVESRNGLNAVGEPEERIIPRWDRETRQLWFAGRLVKVYSRSAESQETILTAFEEDGWPERIDDPLPLAPGLDSSGRLHEAVRRLNRAQLARLLIFERDGTGEGVTWRGIAVPHDAIERAPDKRISRSRIDRMGSQF